MNEVEHHAAHAYHGNRQWFTTKFNMHDHHINTDLYICMIIPGPIAKERHILRQKEIRKTNKVWAQPNQVGWVDLWPAIDWMFGRN